MKKVLILSVFLIFSHNMVDKITKVEIKKVDFTITTIVRIRCGDFEKSFGKEVQTTIVKSPEDIKKFAKDLKDMVVDTTNYLPDVRAKLLIYHKNGKIDTLCLSELGMEYNGKSMLINENIKQFVKSH